MKESGRKEQTEHLTAMQELVCDVLLEARALEFGDFKLNLHNYTPDAPLSPIFIDVTMVQRFPEGSIINAKGAVLTAYEELLAPLKYILLADVPSGATFLVSSLSDRLRRGMVSPIIDLKNTGSGKNVEGLLDEDKGKKAVLVDDVLSRGSSIIRAAGVLRRAGLIVEDAVVLIDRELGGKEQLGKANLNVHSLITLDEMLHHYVRSGHISLDDYHKVIDRLGGLERII